MQRNLQVLTRPLAVVSDVSTVLGGAALRSIPDRQTQLRGSHSISSPNFSMYCERGHTYACVLSPPLPSTKECISVGHPENFAVDT